MNFKCSCCYSIYSQWHRVRCFILVLVLCCHRGMKLLIKSANRRCQVRSEICIQLPPPSHIRRICFSFGIIFRQWVRSSTFPQYSSKFWFVLPNARLPQGSVPPARASKARMPWLFNYLLLFQRRKSQRPKILFNSWTCFWNPAICMINVLLQQYKTLSSRCDDIPREHVAWSHQKGHPCCLAELPPEKHWPSMHLRNRWVPQYQQEVGNLRLHPALCQAEKRM